MNSTQIETPILFLIFNRIDTTRQVFEIIRKVKPTRLFIAADGPRPGNQSDLIKCDEVRKYVTQNIDWPCELKTLFRESNLGCGRSVSSSITWFFENVEKGIILEDDVIPSLSFFPYCEELLNRYENDHRIMSISGSNLLKNDLIGDDSYFFSEYMGIWGWASWARAWKGYDYEISSWSLISTQQKFKKKYTKGQYSFFKVIFDSIGKVNTWDYQWWYHHLVQDGIAIIPSLNLTKNIGFTPDATHTFDADLDIKNSVNNDIQFPLIHPKETKLVLEYEHALAKRFYWKDSSIIKRALKKLLSLMKVYSKK